MLNQAMVDLDINILRTIDTKLGSLEQQVVNLQEAINEIKASDVSRRQSFWAVTSGASVVVLTATIGLWELAISPIREDISRAAATEKEDRIMLEGQIRLAHEQSDERAKELVNRLTFETNKRLPK
jgi:hypothetical protein